MVSEINQSVENIFKSLYNEKKIILYGVSENVVVVDEKSEESFPAIVDEYGEAIPIMIDDDFHLGIYHRILGKSYFEDKGFGDGNGLKCNIEMLLICWGIREKLNANAQTIEEQLIIPSLPRNVLPISTDLDSQRVMRSEFKLPIAPDQFIFSVKYRYTVREMCRK